MPSSFTFLTLSHLNKKAEIHFEGTTDLPQCPTQCDSNLGLQRPAHPTSRTPPHARAPPVGRGATEGCSSTSEEERHLSWLPHSEGSEDSRGKELAGQPTQTLPSSTEIQNNNKTPKTKAMTRIASPCFLQIVYILPQGFSP